MQIQFLGHSCFFIKNGVWSVLIDPFLTGNPFAPVKPEEISATHILVTHAHGDHVGDTEAIAKRSNAKVYGTVEVMQSLSRETDTVGAQMNSRIPTEFGYIKITSALHGSGVPGGLACGFVVEMAGKKIYHAGDTGLSVEMTLLKDEHLDVAMLPIGDFYTMGPEDALRAVEMIEPKVVIPMHFNTFPNIQQDGEAFARDVAEQTRSRALLLQPGESFELI